MTADASEHSIRYVWFDQDDTLYSFHDTMRRALSACLPVIHRHFPETRESLGIAEMERVREDISERATRAEMNFKQARREAFRETLSRYARHEEPLEDLLVSTYYGTLRSEIRPFNDTINCLRNLTAQGLVLGILSDGMSFLEELRLADFFQHRVYAPELGLRKPDPALFEHAAFVAGACPEQCVMVGDNRVCDVVGARDAGWTAIWLNRDGCSWELPSHPPEHMIPSLAELPPLIEALNGECDTPGERRPR